MNAILDDATAKLEHLFTLSRKFAWPEHRHSNINTPITSRQRTASLTDATDETEAGIRELLAALAMAEDGDVDSVQARDAVRAFTKLARSVHERAQEAARMAAELHEGSRQDRAA